MRPEFDFPWYDFAVISAEGRRSPHRDGGQAQYVVAPVRERPGRIISQVLDWARKRLAEPLQINELAQHAAMSERTFLRHFREGVGMTPVAWLQRERMFRAQELLEASDSALDDVAVQCGYQSLETLRVAFRHDQPARDAIGNLAAEIAPNQVQAGVDASRTPGRRDHIALGTRPQCRA
jgi:AraC-like DNA-binding protein